MNSMALVFGDKGSSIFSMPSRNTKPCATPRRDTAERDGPEWSQGLRQLYNSVVEEPLPDNFKDLLAQLNKGA